MGTGNRPSAVIGHGQFPGGSSAILHEAGGPKGAPELTKCAFSVTCLGKLGGIVSTPEINHPEVAIVGINRVVARPMVRDGTVQGRQMMILSSKFDLGVVAGVVAEAYIQRGGNCWMHL